MESRRIYLIGGFMELKATLNKPYNDSERIDFIIEQNRHNGYEVKETEQALEAWGFTEEEIAEQAKQEHKQELLAQLDAVDLKTIRPLRAIQAGTGTQEDTDKVEELEAQAEQIRGELRELED